MIAFWVLNLISISCFPSTANLVFSYENDFKSTSNVSWVIAQPGESHALACQRVKSKPLSDSILNLNWNISVMNEIVIYHLNLKSLGIRGCCTPGLWCDQTGCFTQYLGTTFRNIGWMNNYTKASPVFSCTDSDSSMTMDLITLNTDESFIHRNVVKLKFDFNHLENDNQVNDEHLREIISSSLQLTAKEEVCPNPKLCNNNICKPCDLQNSCSIDNVCLITGGSSSCFQFCSSGMDSTCPCGTRCDTVNVFSRDKREIITVNLCTPLPFSTLKKEKICQGFRSGSTLQCQMPRLGLTTGVKPVDIDNIDTTGLYIPIDLITGDSAIYHMDMPYSLDSLSCEIHADCSDGNVCTIDRCMNHRCEFESISECDSIANDVMWQQSPMTYLPVFHENMTLSQTQFQSLIKTRGKLSSISNIDDSPVDSMALPFSFVYFGNLVNKIALNPNGILTLPPIFPCTASIGTIECVTYSSDTNTISLWSRDWDLSRNPSSAVYYEIQKEGNIDATSFHVFFENIAEFDSSSAPTSPHSSTNNSSTPLQNPPLNSFSASIYIDGSIRIRYHEVNSRKSDRDNFGLWAAKMSQDSSVGNVYNTEVIPHSFVSTGNDVTYCPVNTTACIVEACAFEHSVVKVQWNGASCLALELDSSIDTDVDSDVEDGLQVRCVWGGGYLGITKPFWEYLSPNRSSSNFRILNCPVPNLNNFVQEGSTVSLDIIVSMQEQSQNSLGGGHLAQSSSTNEAGNRKIFGVYRSRITQELSRANLMVKYHKSNEGKESISCGCSALSEYSGYQCDQANVCGGNDDTMDCAGSAFGSAYFDSCGDCVGGMTGKVPSEDCNSLWKRKKTDDGFWVLSEALSLLLLSLMSFVIYTMFTHLIRLRILRHHARLRNQNLRELENIFQVDGLRIHSALSTSNTGLTKAELDTIGEFEYQHTRDDKDETKTSSSLPQHQCAGASDCPICLVEICPGDQCRVMPEPCGHMFHVACIDEWFKQSIVCPLCKRSLRSILADSSPSYVPNRQISRSFANFFISRSSFTSESNLPHVSITISPLESAGDDDTRVPLQLEQQQQAPNSFLHSLRSSLSHTYRGLSTRSRESTFYAPLSHDSLDASLHAHALPSSTISPLQLHGQEQAIELSTYSSPCPGEILAREDDSATQEFHI